MSKKVTIYITLCITILFGSTVYGIMLNQVNYKVLNLENTTGDKVISYIELHSQLLTDNTEKSERNSKVNFIMDKTSFTEDIANYLIDQCKEKGLNLFMVLGLMKLESNFNPKLVGSKGERGLGQLMENTAKPLAKNLDLKYDPDLLFEPKYNILLFTTQLQYLEKVYKDDRHKVLTAYNRGQYGLKKYMASRRNSRNPAVSIYSSKVLQYANKFELEYENEYNIDMGK